MNLKTAFDYTVRSLLWVALFLCGLALVDFVLHPLAPGFAYHSALYRAVVLLVFTPLSLLVGFLIMRRVPGNPVGPFLILWAGTVVFRSVSRDMWPPPLALFSVYDIGIGWMALFLMVVHFPDGKIYPPAAARWVYASSGASVILGFIVFFSHASLYPGRANPLTIPALQAYSELITLLSVVAVSPVWVLAVFSPALRYRKGSHLERQQIKWLALFGGLLAVGSILGFVFYPLLTGGQMFSPEGSLFSLIFFSSASVFPPLIIGLAVLRYRLWEIDIIIRKTLVYGTLTAALGLVYFGGVTLLQGLFTLASGQSSPAALVISTLLIAALFNPLRRRIQGFIDRRFYRRKYDAERALARFALAARSETNLDALTSTLVAVVGETVQPRQITIWFKPSPSSFEKRIHG